jgi:hypothetical protein
MPGFTIGPVEIATATISLVALFFSFWSFHRTQRQTVAPVLVFARTTEQNWVLQNVGPGAALNVLLGDGDSHGGWEVTGCHPIAAGAAITLPWLQHGDRLAATYSDSLNNYYTTICGDYYNKLAQKNCFPEWVRKAEEYSLRAHLRAEATEPLV